MRKVAVRLAGILAASMIAGCPGDRRDEAIEPIPPQGRTPVQQMQATLAEVVDAQERHLEELGRYADDTRILMERFDFRPVGETAVTIGFQGTEPQWGYLATAMHPESDRTCQVQYGRPGPEEPGFGGEVMC